MFDRTPDPTPDDLTPFIATVVQKPPVFLDLQASVARACELIAEAAGEGARLVVFPETWLPGYPIWLDVAPGAALWDSEPANEVFKRLFLNSPTLESPAIRRICAAAREARALVVMGMNERAGSSLYNTMLYIGADGALLGRHRKLMPTYTERLVWGRGDGSSLTAVDSDLGRIGGLICWEHWMPLTRYAMHAQGELLHVAQWPTVKEMSQVASRNYAFEGQCFVLAAGTVLQKSEITACRLALFEGVPGEPDALLMRGGSAIIAPNGNYLAGPVYDEPAFVSAEIRPELAISGRLTLDVTGHYSRPDIFTLLVDEAPQVNIHRRRRG